MVTCTMHERNDIYTTNNDENHAACINSNSNSTTSKTTSHGDQMFLRAALQANGGQQVQKWIVIKINNKREQLGNHKKTNIHETTFSDSLLTKTAGPCARASSEISAYILRHNCVTAKIEGRAAIQAPCNGEDIVHTWTSNTIKK